LEDRNNRCPGVVGHRVSLRGL